MDIRDSEAAKVAYDAGWKASMRVSSLDRAEARFENKHRNPANMFSAGYADFAIGDRPKWYSFDREGYVR